MAQLRRQPDGTYTVESNGKTINLGNLDMAAKRGTSADIANVAYASKNYGYSAGSGSGVTSASGSTLPATPSLTPASQPVEASRSNSEADIFNLLVRDSLIKFQGVNTADLEKKKRALQLAAIGKQSEITPEDLRTLSPEQQSSIRSGNLKALQPEFDDVSYQLNKAQQATANFEKVYEKVMAISQDYAEKMVAPDSVIQNYKQLIEANPDNINTYLSNVNDKTKQAILAVLDYTKMKPGTSNKTETVKAGKDTFLLTYDAEGNIISKQLIGTEEDEPEESKPSIVTINGVQYEWDEDTQTWVTPSIPDVPSTDKASKAADIITKIDSILNNENISKAIGPKSSQIPQFLRSGVRNDVDAAIDNLISSIAIENLSLLKGPMSDRDIEFIKEASAGLKKNMSEEGFKKQLKLLKNKFEEIKKKAEDPLQLFNSVGSDTDKAVSKAITTPDNTKAGQCGRFVNKYTGLGLGDTYQSKLAKMNKSIKTPQPGMVFVMPYKDTGHTGFIISINNGIATVKDSNYYLDEKVRTHQIPVSKMTGFAIV